MLHFRFKCAKRLHLVCSDIFIWVWTAYLFSIVFLFGVFQYVLSQAVENYNVTVQKTCGEPAKAGSYSLKAQTVTLFLSYSAYKLSISAVNKAGSSPAAHLLIDAVEDHSGRSSQIFITDTMWEYMRIYVIRDMCHLLILIKEIWIDVPALTLAYIPELFFIIYNSTLFVLSTDLDRAFKVNLMGNNSFRLLWNDTLSKKYPCYSVEWWASDEELACTTVYTKENNHTVENLNGTSFPDIHFKSLYEHVWNGITMKLCIHNM